MKRKRLIIVISVLIGMFGLLTILTNRSFSVPLENDIEVEPNTELIYYIDVFYGGKDISNVESNDSTISGVYSKIVHVNDILPAGLTFEGFVTTSDGTIGATRINSEESCGGYVIDDTLEATNEGVWNSNNTEYTYHGLHYNASTREVTFKVKSLRAGCKLTVGVITKTPATIDDPSTTVVEKRRDFYNTANGNENSLSIKSNTVHVYMGGMDEDLYSVKYEYTGTVPSEAPTVPDMQSYAQNTTVNVANSPVVNGYVFSGWTSEDVTINNGLFTMPNRMVTLKGSFDRIDPYKVTYEIEGVKPNSYVVPLEKSYYKGNTVDLDLLKSGDIVDGYIFSGWTSEDVTISTDNDFEMPNKNVLIKGSFEAVKYTLSYEFSSGVLPPNSDSYLPPAKEYAKGEEVTLDDVLGIPNGYVFLGWNKENTFEMPEHDLVVRGTWMRVNGYFSPTITKEITNPKEAYEKGEEVLFKIKVTNNANFAIKDVIIKELNDDVVYLDGTDYTIDTDHFVTIPTIPSKGSVEVSAKYIIKNTDRGTLENTVELRGALADNDYILEDKEYKATVSFFAKSKLIINKIDQNNNPLAGAEFGLYEQVSGTIKNDYLTNSVDREDFKSITIVDHLNIPDGAVNWDISVEKNGSIMAWYMDNGCKSTNTCDLYMGQVGGITPSYISFAYLSNVTEMDLSKLNTSNMTSMAYMFAGNNNLTELDLSSFDTSKVYDMRGMFEGCSNLTSLNLTNFDTSKVEDMTFMFSNCSSLKVLDLSSFNTESLIYFVDDSGENPIDFHGEARSVLGVAGMFIYNSNLETIYVSESWEVNRIKTFFDVTTEPIFSGCVKLPNYSIPYVSKLYYGGDGLGYLTYKAYTPNGINNSNNNDFKINNLVRYKNANNETIKRVANINVDGLQLLDSGLEFYLTPGKTYYLKETKAPTGYILKTHTYEIVVDNNGNIKIDGLSLEASSNLSEFIFDIENEPINILPNTGGIGTTIFVISGTLLVLVGLLGTIFISNKEKKKKRTKKKRSRKQ